MRRSGETAPSPPSCSLPSRRMRAPPSHALAWAPRPCLAQGLCFGDVGLCVRGRRWDIYLSDAHALAHFNRLSACATSSSDHRKHWQGLTARPPPGRSQSLWNSDRTRASLRDRGNLTAFAFLCSLDYQDIRCRGTARAHCRPSPCVGPCRHGPSRCHPRHHRGVQGRHQPQEDEPGCGRLPRQ